jgi:hypothetical protein
LAESTAKIYMRVTGSVFDVTDCQWKGIMALQPYMGEHNQMDSRNEGDTRDSEFDYTLLSNCSRTRAS